MPPATPAVVSEAGRPGSPGSNAVAPAPLAPCAAPGTVIGARTVAAAVGIAVAARAAAGASVYRGVLLSADAESLTDCAVLLAPLEMREGGDISCVWRDGLVPHAAASTASEANAARADPGRCRSSGRIRLRAGHGPEGPPLILVSVGGDGLCCRTPRSPARSVESACCSAVSAGAVLRRAALYSAIDPLPKRVDSIFVAGFLRRASGADVEPQMGRLILRRYQCSNVSISDSSRSHVPGTRPLS